MTKKEYLLKILNQLEPIWELAPGLEVIVEQGAFGDDVLDVLVGAIESGIHSARSEIAKIRMKKGLDTLERMKHMEKQSAMQDEKELEKLDKMIDDF